MLKKITLLGLWVAGLLLVVGANARLLGLGHYCPEWLGCSADGNALASSETPWLALLGQAQFWLAMIVTVLMLGSWLLSLREVSKTIGIAIPSVILLTVLALLGLGVLQVHFGAIPWLVTLQMFLGFGMVFLIWRFYLLQGPQTPMPIAASYLRWLSTATLVVLFLEILSGGWVSSNYAALACRDFPRCQGEWWPVADFKAAFLDLSRLALEQASLASPEARVAMQLVHRATALVFFALASILAYGVTSNPKFPHLSKPGLLLNILLLLQVGTGILQIHWNLLEPLAAAHCLFAIGLLLDVAYLQFFLVSGRKSLQGQETGEVPPREGGVTLEDGPPKKASRSADSYADRLSKTRGGFKDILRTLSQFSKGDNRELLDELESQLIMADVGVHLTQEITQDLVSSLGQEELSDDKVLASRLRAYLEAVLKPVDQPLVVDSSGGPFVILVVGVNGVGKTTTIGKLAKQFQSQGYKVMLAAGDTFRAAAVEQLETWGDRNGVPVIAQHTGADSASVIFDALQAAQARGVDVLIADTAGRLHNKSNLMDELSKVKRIMSRLDASAPHEVLLVLDGGTGQNALNQADQFNEAVGVTGIVLTKLDGTAKGGVVFGLAKRLGIPIRFIGIGEGVDDLQPFNASRFIQALFENEAPN